MLSEEKITHLTHMILKGLLDKDLIDIIEEEEKVRRTIKRILRDQVKSGEQMDETVRKKIGSLSRGVIEGSPEWDVLYQKFYREEEVKKGMSS